MTRKRARAKFYAELRRIAPYYRWFLVGGSLRAKLIKPKSKELDWPWFCPLTAVKPKDQNGYRITLNSHEISSRLFGLDPKDGLMIADSADNMGSKFNKQVRQTLLKCVGL